MTNPKPAVPDWAIDAWLELNGWENVSASNYLRKFQGQLLFLTKIRNDAAIIARHSDKNEVK